MTKKTKKEDIQEILKKAQEDIRVPFVPVPTSIIRATEEITDKEFRVYMIICTFAYGNGVCFISDKALKNLCPTKTSRSFWLA